MATKKYLDYAGLKRVLAKLLPGARKIWHGTLAEWEALSAAEKAEYDQAEVIDEYTGVPVVVDKIEAGNLNPVTSNAVAGIEPTSPSAQVVLGNNVGDLSTTKTFTVNQSGLLKVHFLKLSAGNTIRLYVNDRLVDSVPNYVGSAGDVTVPITTGVLIAFVKAGDIVTISTDGNGENWYVQNVTVQPISWFTN